MSVLANAACFAMLTIEFGHVYKQNNQSLASLDIFISFAFLKNAKEKYGPVNGSECFVQFFKNLIKTVNMS